MGRHSTFCHLLKYPKHFPLQQWMNDILPSLQRASWIRRISMDYSKKFKCSMILLCTECIKWDYFHNAINKPGDLDSVQSIFSTQIHNKYKQSLQHISACDAHEYALIYSLEYFCCVIKSLVSDSGDADLCTYACMHAFILKGHVTICTNRRIIC